MDVGTVDVAVEVSSDVASDVSPDVPEVAVDVEPDPVEDTGPTAAPYPAPGAWPANTGPGGPARTFTEDELYINCATIDGGDLDFTDHHNLVTMYDGYLLMPWAPEWGRGGLTFFDISDPCAPTVAGTGFSETMRETHSLGFSQHAEGRWTVVNQRSGLLDGGMQFWDVSNPAEPVAVADMNLPGFIYPDAYARVTLSVFWQAPFVYAASADNGVHIVDATDPRNPEFVGQYIFDPILRAGQVHAVGNLLIVTAAEGPRTALLDISDPTDPLLINEFNTVDEFDIPRENYFSNISGGYSFYARKEGAGGLFVYDIRDPMNPVKAGQVLSLGNGGYVFVKDGLAFVGESSSAAIYDVSDLSDITQVARLDLEGDLDTMTPIGNMAVLSVDDEANPNEGTALAPYALEPDSVAPAVNWVYPNDGATNLLPTSRIGLTFTEFIDAASAWDGSVRLYRTGEDPAATRVEGIISTQENVVNFWPVDELEPNTGYTLELPVGGVSDFNGNAIETPFTMSFTTGS
ncbi:MAG: hypothetical protein ACJAYU_001993 [Bradymonadia bacterium]|jgi:hypothetical protein